MNDHAFILGFSVFVMLSCGVPTSRAQDGGDGMTVEWMASIIDHESRKLGGTKTVAEHLRSQFDISNDVIIALREQKVGYGEMGAIFSMAEQMPGGINQDNIHEILSLRSNSYSARNWDTIAEYMGIDRERFIRRINALAFDFPKIEEGQPRHLTFSR